MKKGLSSGEAAKLLRKYGRNELKSAGKDGILKKFLMQMNDFMIYTLLAAAGISFGVSYIKGEPDYVEPVIILIIIVVNGIVGVIQEAKAEQSINSLKKMAAPQAVVLRDSTWVKINAAEVVPGDIIMLETGNMIPADGCILSGDNLMTDESALTGESIPVNKNELSAGHTQDNTIDDSNMVYSGCVVCYGHGTALVTATGMSTRIGHIAGMLINEPVPDTPLQKKLAQTGRILSITSLIICIVIFVMGLIKNIPPLDMFMTSVSLAVAAIPEGLPAIVTIMLSIGVTRMASKRAIIRRLPAVETLGSTTVICSDKTGTLTLNKMTVKNIYNISGILDSGNSGHNKILSLAALCCNSIIQNDSVIGEPTENAIISAAADALNIDSLYKEYPRVKEYPFDSKRKLMSTVHKNHNSIISVTKGASDVLIPMCSYYSDDYGNISPLSSDMKKTILKDVNSLAGEGLRIIAVAYKEKLKSYNMPDVENNMIYAGIITMIDPPRPEVPDSVKECHLAGIRTIMITGDHAATALNIAEELGITSSHNMDVITGPELENMSDDNLRVKSRHCNVYARVTPEHKLRIVKALQANGEITAMTGDGVNDAPALKAADIGCAMGASGTDVARNASDMILEDDNFATITAAVREGRNIYDNIRKAVHFLISCNIGEILTIFLSIMLGLITPLTPVQLLWINLITDSLPALSLGFEPPAGDIMRKKPIIPGKSIFSDGMGFRVLYEGLFIGSISLVAYAIGCRSDYITGSTMCFAVLSLSQISHSFNSRSESSLRHIGFFSNPRLIISAIICITLQTVVICIPSLHSIFNTTSLTVYEWGMVILLSLLPVPVVELQKQLSTEAK